MISPHGSPWSWSQSAKTRRGLGSSGAARIASTSFGSGSTGAFFRDFAAGFVILGLPCFFVYAANCRGLPASAQAMWNQRELARICAPKRRSPASMSLPQWRHVDRPDLASSIR
jgi:hypothetical protein